MAALDLKAVTDALHGRRLRGPLMYRPRTTSTNDDALALAAAGAAEGTVVVAGEQTRGRGRYERAWFGDPDRSLMCSIIFRPTLPVAHFTRLVNLTGVAVAEACAVIGGCTVGTKWPNDIICDGRKLGGILVEARPPDYAVVGLGLNVLGDAADLPEELRASATSLATHATRPVTREGLLAAILNGLDAAYDALLAGCWEGLLDRQRALETTLGTTRTVAIPGDSLTGVVRDLAPDGGLIIETAAGLRTITVGEVS